MPTESIAVLAPLHHLPSEGAEPTGTSSTAPTPTGPRALLDFYASLVVDGGVGFHVSSDGIETLGDFAPVFQFLEVRGGSPAPQLDLSPSYSDLHLPGDAELPLDADSSPDDYARAFLGHLNASLRLAARGFRGHPVPLVRWQALADGPGLAVQCRCIWRADVATRRTLSVDGADPAFALVLENPEVEGRGLREAIAALAIAGIFLGSVSDADAGIGSRRARSSQSEKAASKVSPKLRADVDHKILGQASSGNTHLLVDISKQRAYLLVNGQVAIDTPVSTARANKYTPRGTFKITQKVRSGKTSTIYGCDLPCWMRLGDSPFGLHVGDLPGYPASAGCVRLPSNIAPLIFDHAPSGTVVKIVDSVNLDTYVKAF